MRQSLPAVEDINTFLSSHQVAVAQLAIEYCNALINDTTARASYFPGFNFGAAPATAFGGAGRDAFVDPLIANQTTGSIGYTKHQQKPGQYK